MCHGKKKGSSPNIDVRKLSSLLNDYERKKIYLLVIQIIYVHICVCVYTCVYIA